MKTRVYHRTHIAHIRIDRMHALIRRSSNNRLATWSIAGILACWLSSLLAGPFLPVKPSVASAKSSAFARSCANTLPVHVAGGGDGPRGDFLQDPAVVDLTKFDDAEDIQSSFDCDAWIGKGIEWSDSLPNTIKCVFAQKQRTPTWLSNIVIPPAQSSVLDLLDTPLPTASTTSTPVPSHDPPNTFLDPTTIDDFTLLDHPVLLNGRPLYRAIESLNLPQAWLSGCKSIAFDNCLSRYPLWIGSFVCELDNYRIHRAQWETAHKWLHTMGLSASDAPPEMPDIIDECRIRLAAVPWRGDIPGFGKAVQFTASHLATFLSNSWLDDEMINAGSAWILRQRNTSGDHVEIIDCLHLQRLQHAQRSVEGPYMALTPIDNRIQSGDIAIIFNILVC